MSTSIVLGNLSLSIALVAVLGLVLLLLAVGGVYTYRNNLFCWSDRKMQRYGLVPHDDEEQVVKLTYSDDLDEDI